MSKPVMTPQDAAAVEAARREFHASVERFDRAIQELRPMTDVDEALKVMNEKQAAYRALAEKLWSYVTEEGEP